MTRILVEVCYPLDTLIHTSDPLESPGCAIAENFARSKGSVSYFHISEASKRDKFIQIISPWENYALFHRYYFIIVFSQWISPLVYFNSLDPERCLKKSHDYTYLDDVKLENIEENVVTVALETILLNASWLFPTSKGESVKWALLNRGNPQENGHHSVAEHKNKQREIKRKVIFQGLGKKWRWASKCWAP